MVRRSRLIAMLALLLASLTGCTLLGPGQSTGGTKIVLLTHSSFAVADGLFAEFTKNTGITIEQRALGDAGALTNQLILSKANPLGDVVFGIDSTFASRALENDILEPYQSPEANQGARQYQVNNSDALSAVDIGDVCLNIDLKYFADRNLAEPRNLIDLAEPRYRDLLVVSDPATSSPGLAFLFATIAQFGEQGWLSYWQKLKGNGAKVVSSWEEVYRQEFSASGKGSRPIALSYASSPAAEINPDGTSRTKALLDTCYRQVEYAGILKGTKQAPAARKVVDFLLSEKFQNQLAENMYVYPTRQGISLPSNWSQVAPLPNSPASLPPTSTNVGREKWIAQWRSLFFG